MSSSAWEKKIVDQIKVIQKRGLISDLLGGWDLDTSMSPQLDKSREPEVRSPLPWAFFPSSTLLI